MKEAGFPALDHPGLQCRDKTADADPLQHENVAQAAAFMEESLWISFIPFLLQGFEKSCSTKRNLVLRTIKSKMLSNNEFCQHVVVMSNESPGECPLLGPKGLLEFFLEQSIKEEATMDESVLMMESIPLIYQHLKDHNHIKSDSDMRVIRTIFESSSSRLHRHAVLSLLHVLLQCRPQCSQALSTSTILRDYPSIHQGCPKCGFQADGAPGLLLVAHGTAYRTRLLAMDCATLFLTHLPLSRWMQHSNEAHTMWSYQNKVIRAVEDLLRVGICKPFHLKLSAALLKHVPFNNQKTLHALGVRLVDKAASEGFTDEVLKACLGGRLDTRGRFMVTPSPVETWIEQSFDFASLHSQPDQSIAVLQALPNLVLGTPKRMERILASLLQEDRQTTQSAFCEALLKGRKLRVDDNRMSVETGRVFVPALVAALNSHLDQDPKCQSSYCSAMGFLYHCDWESIPTLTRRKCLENVLGFCASTKNHSNKDLVDGFKALGHLCSSLIRSERDSPVSIIGEELYEKIALTMVEAKRKDSVQCMVLFSVGNLFHSLNESANDRGLLPSPSLPSLVALCHSALQQHDNDKIYANAMRAGCRLTSWLLRHQVVSLTFDDFMTEVLRVCSASLRSASMERNDESRKVKQRVTRNGCSACHSLVVLVSCGVLSVERFAKTVEELLNSWVQAVLMIDRICEKSRFSLVATLATIEQSKLVDIVTSMEDRVWSDAIRSVFLYAIESPDKTAVDHCFNALANMIAASSRKQFVTAFDSISVHEGKVKEAFERLLRSTLSKETLRKLGSGLFVIGLDFATEQQIHNLLNIVDDSEEL